MTDLTVREAAIELGVTAGRVRHWIIDKRIKAIKRGRDNFIRKREVERFKMIERKPGRPWPRRDD